MMRMTDPVLSLVYKSALPGVGPSRHLSFPPTTVICLSVRPQFMLNCAVVLIVDRIRPCCATMSVSRGDLSRLCSQADGSGCRLVLLLMNLTSRYVG